MLMAATVNVPAFVCSSYDHLNTSLVILIVRRLEAVQKMQGPARCLPTR